MTAIAIRDVSVTVGASSILSEVTLEARAGEVLALIGPNGAGKSTLLGVMAGDIPTTGGRVELLDRDIRRITHGERSRMRSVLLQENTVTFPFTVREVIAMGRSPWPQPSDVGSSIAEAVDEADVAHLLDREYTGLSGGEKARVSLARVLAQATEVVLLDEPTAALDLRHQEEVMAVARRLAGAGRAVVVVLHDLTLAGAYGDRIALLEAGRLVAVGAPSEVLTASVVAEVYGLPVEIIERDGHPMVLPLRARKQPDREPRGCLRCGDRS